MTLHLIGKLTTDELEREIERHAPTRDLITQLERSPWPRVPRIPVVIPTRPGWWTRIKEWIRSNA
jgi:hypothetical protein